jgi:hypothetical protein
MNIILPNFNMEGPDNVIQLVFDKMCNKMTDGYKHLTMVPFKTICSSIFENHFVWECLNKLTFRSVDFIRTYLSNKKFQFTYVRSKLKNIIDTHILFGQTDKVLDLIKNNYKISSSALKLAVINGNLDVMSYLISLTKPTNKIGTELLTISAEYGYEDIYFYLRDLGYDPNIQTYHKAVMGSNTKIVTDIKALIGISKKTVELAFKGGSIGVVKLVIKTAVEEDLKIPPEYVSYIILNGNVELLENVLELMEIRWDPILFYSAVLSGSMEMIKYIETKIPDIHCDFVLDMSRDKKGQKSLLLDSMIYEIGNKKYFSHTTNYAVQSGNLDVLKYICELNYGITLSNIVNAIQLGSVEILEYLLKKYWGKLPGFLISYFSIGSYLLNKVEMFKVLVEHGFDFNAKNSTLDDYRAETAHLQLIEKEQYAGSDLIWDMDYLLNYQAFFVVSKGYKFNSKLVTQVRMCCMLELINDLDVILGRDYHDVDKQIMIDTAWLFGTLDHVRRVYGLHGRLPGMNVVMEIFCYGKIGKVSWLLQINPEMVKKIYPLSLVLDDTLVNGLMSKFRVEMNCQEILKALITSGKSKLVKEFIKQNEVEWNTELVKEILLMNDMELVSVLDYNMIKDLEEWIVENDLIEVYEFIKNNNF